MQLHLIRHPRPDVAPGICYGQTDLGLAESAAAVAARLRPLLPESFALHASPLARARLLAEALGTPRLDNRLKEIHFGDWRGAASTTSAPPSTTGPPIRSGSGRRAVSRRTRWRRGCWRGWRSMG